MGRTKSSKSKAAPPPQHPLSNGTTVEVTVRWKENLGKRVEDRGVIRIGTVIGNAGNIVPPWRWVSVDVPGVENTMYPIEDVRDVAVGGHENAAALRGTT